MSDPAAKSDQWDAEHTPIVRMLTSGLEANRRITRILAASVALDIMLSFGFGYVAWKANQNAETANSALTQSRIQCASSNDARGAQLKLWNYILSFPPQPGMTAKQKKETAKQVKSFKAYIKNVFAPRDCSSDAIKRQQKALSLPTFSIQHPGTPTVLVTPGTTQTVIVVPVAPTTEEAAPSQSAQPQHSRTAQPTGRPTSTPTRSPSPSPTPTCVRVPVVGKLCPAKTLEVSTWQPQQSNSVTNSSGTMGIGLVVVVLQGSLLCACVTSSRAQRRRTRQQ